MKRVAWPLGCMVMLAVVVAGCAGGSVQGQAEAAYGGDLPSFAPAPSPVATTAQYTATMCRLTNTLATAIVALQAVDGRASRTVIAGVSAVPGELTRADRLFASVEHWSTPASGSLGQPATEVETLLSGISPSPSSVAPATRLAELVLRAAERDLALDEQGGQTATGLTARLVQAFATARITLAQRLGLPLPVQIPLGYEIACPSGS